MGIIPLLTGIHAYLLRQGKIAAAQLFDCETGQIMQLFYGYPFRVFQ
jgi:hypothetical protein